MNVRSVVSISISISIMLTVEQVASLSNEQIIMSMHIHFYFGKMHCFY